MRFVHTLVALACLLLPALGAQSAFAQAKTFKVDKTGNKIQFVSDATLEKITGVSTDAAGDLTVDPAKPADAKGTFRVEVASIRTGVDLRDEHLKGDAWLDAKKTPHIEFTITKISGIDKLAPNTTHDATVTGKFTMHGVTREVTTKAKVRWTPAAGASKDTMRIVASFTVKLEDHKVSVPQIVRLKVAPEIQVNVDLHATAS
jgi:polyisoprenoid-binding protein YceI